MISHLKCAFKFEQKDGNQSWPQCKTIYERQKGSPRMDGDDDEDNVDDLDTEFNYAQGHNKARLPWQGEDVSSEIPIATPETRSIRSTSRPLLDLEFSPTCLNHNINERKETYHGVPRPRQKVQVEESKEASLGIRGIGETSISLVDSSSNIRRLIVSFVVILIATCDTNEAATARCNGGGQKGSPENCKAAK
ncbi:hypothetical protein M9H77_36512 [Catharanthus roseus]|uniref:Uncharacterized protein n=1 Tax=Catharanthus roseus TaxID=4058 RepID=A0ACB9ZWA1_CATRO|nr:hypothetical protein M9H77_36512 [Catharanthus roseus]